MRVAVTGGSGRLGCALVRALLARSDQVTVLSLSAGTPPSLAGLDVRVQQGSVLVAADVRELVKDAELVFHLAAKVDLDRDRDGSIHAVNVDGTRLVASACLERRIRMLHCSSHHALVLEPLSRPLDESKPLALEDKCDYHRSKAEGELLVRRMIRTRGLDAVIVNPGSLIGPDDYEPSMIGKALLDLYHHRIPVLMEVLSDYVDARDVAAGMIAAAERAPQGERYLLTGEVLDMRALVRIWEELTEVPMPRLTLPLWVAWAALPFTLTAARLMRRQPLFTPNMLRHSVSNRVVSHAKATAELGFSPRPARVSLADALAFYRAQGWITSPA